MPTDAPPSREDRIRNAWLGRVSGCMLGKPVEAQSMTTGPAALEQLPADHHALPARWTEPWGGRIETSLAGTGELAVDDLIARTVALVGAH